MKTKTYHWTVVAQQHKGWLFCWCWVDVRPKNNIRLHYGFQSTRGHFLDFARFCLDPGENPEDVYQHLVAFVEDNLVYSWWQYIPSRRTAHWRWGTFCNYGNSHSTDLVAFTWIRIANTYKTVVRHGITIRHACLHQTLGIASCTVLAWWISRGRRWQSNSHFRRFPRQPGTSSGKGSTIKQGSRLFLLQRSRQVCSAVSECL